MAEVKITNENELEAWLKNKPREWALVIAARAALRVVPSWQGFFALKFPSKGYRPDNAVLSLFRCVAVSRLGAVLPDQNVPSAHFAATIFAADSGAVTAASYSAAAYSASESAAYSAAYSALAAAAGTPADTANYSSSPVASAYSATYSAADSAAYAIRAFSDPAFSRALRARRAARANAPSDPVAARKANRDLARYAGQSAVWKAVESDVLALEKSVPSVITGHLWRGKSISRDYAESMLSNEVPSWAIAGWKRLKQHLGNADNWQVWTDWYEAILEGRAAWGLSHEAGNEIMFEALTWPEEEWKQGPAHVNQRIADLIEKSRAEVVPKAPAIGEGVDFQWQDGKLKLQARLPAGMPRNSSAAVLHDRVRARLPRLREMAGKLGNTNPDLALALGEYVDVATRPLDAVDDDLFWASGVAVMAQAAAYEKQNQGTTLTAHLEPEQLALLVEVAGLHGGLVMNLPNGADLSEKASRAKLPRAELAEPTQHLLKRFADSVRLVDQRTRNFINVQLGAVSAAGWETAGAGYAAYASTRTLIIRTGEIVTSATGIATGIVGTTLISTIAAHNGWDIAAANALVELLRSNASPITTFAQSSPEMRAWTRYVLQLLEDDHAAKMHR